MAGDLYESGLAELQLITSIRFPSDRYAADPLAFFREILGVEPWARARDLIEAVRTNARVSVKAGRKVAKSHTVAGLALWFYCSFADARVVMTSTTAQQVERVLWREITMMYARSGRCLACKLADPNGPRPCPHSTPVDGDLAMLPSVGLKVRDLDRGDFREIYGFTSKQGEAVQGISGTRLFYILDEASGIADFVYEAIEGNRAGGARVLLTGNPTRTEGEFFDSHNAKKLDPQDPESTGYVSITISSEESPNVVEGREVIPGLATRSFIKEREKEWGRESPLFKIHVLGEFAMGEDGRIFSIDLINEARMRWEMPRTKRDLERAVANGERIDRLYIGIDPAGETGTGDESCFAPRRGWNAEEPIVERGLDDDGHLRRLLEIIGARALPREQPVVVVDRTGSVGAGLYARLSSYLYERERQGHPPPFVLVGLKYSDKAPRNPELYDTQRDELCANLEIAFRGGAAIPDDPKLEQELHVLEWTTLPNGRSKVTSKDEIKKRIGRSPDRYDALSLAFWEEVAITSPGARTPEAERSAARVHDDLDDIDPSDPFDAGRAWRR